MKPIDQLSDDELTQTARHAAELPDAPPAQIQAAINLWSSANAGSVRESARALRRVAAALSFDSLAQPTMALGMRAATSDTRRLMFSAEDRDINLRVDPTADHYVLSGRVLGSDESGMVELSLQDGDLPSRAGPRITVLDPLGQFRLDGVDTGTYRLTLRLGADLILLPPIGIGTRA